MEEVYDEAVVTAAEAILRQILLHLAQRAENELFAMCCVEYAAVIPAFSAEMQSYGAQDLSQQGRTKVLPATRKVTVRG